MERGTVGKFIVEWQATARSLASHALIGAGLAGSEKTAAFISEGRLDGLTDGVYAFAMTLLVVNMELPEGFRPQKQSGASVGARPSLRYVHRLCHHFLVLASFWLGRAQASDGPETASAAYAWASILHLFPVTFMPFAMLVAGRFDYPAAIWLYAANMIVLALSVIAISLIAGTKTGRARLPDGSIELGILIASALLSVAIGGSRRATRCMPICSTLPRRSSRLRSMAASPRAIVGRSAGPSWRTSGMIACAGAARGQETRVTFVRQLSCSRFHEFLRHRVHRLQNSVKRSGMGRLASLDGGLPDSPCSRS